MPRTSLIPLFPVYHSAEDYKRSTGRDAPPYDQTQVPKQWEDPHVSIGADPSYLFPINGVTRPVLVSRTVSAAVAARVNFVPSHPSYARYVIPPTNAMAPGANSSSPSFAVSFSTEDDARAMVADLAASGLLTDITYADVPTDGVTYGSDGRKMWAIRAKRGNVTVDNQVGGLLEIRHANGVNAPGHWTLSMISDGTADLHWVSEITGDPIVVGPPFPIPVQPIPANAHLEGSGIGMSAMDAIVVTPDPPVVGVGTLGAAGFAVDPTVGPKLDALQATMNEIRDMVNQLVNGK